MRPARLVLRALAFHARAHAATALGAAAAGAVLTGALVLGDSVRASLARAARLRSGTLEHVLGSGERFFAADLAERMARGAPGLVAEPAIQLPAVAALPDASGRVPDAQLLGVRAGFFALAPEPFAAEPGAEEAWAGPELARRLALATGSELVLRVPRPSATTRELALVSAEDAIQVLRVRVTRLLSDDEFGAFALEAGAAPRANLFVSHAWLAQRLGVPQHANRVFLRGADPEPALRDAWQLADVGLSWKPVAGASELVSDQVFLPPAVLDALAGACGDPSGAPLALLGYFVNAIALGHAPDAPSTPYSTVVALGSPCPAPAADLGGWRAALGATLDAPTAPPSIVLNEWTAEDLGAAVGDEIVLRYFVLGAGRRLEERSSAFRLVRILPTAGFGADPSLAPEFPGIGDAENCRDWDPGIPIELERLRDRDEEYWDLHRGAPKAFIDLATARTLFGNRFGETTALRFAPGQEPRVTALLRARPPGELGLPLRPVSAESAASTDFGALFLGLSMFLIASALLLTGLFFAFSIERRAAELGVLRVSGFRAGEVARLVLAEALVVCLAGAALGLVLGGAYTRLLLAALERRWSGAVGRTELHFALAPGTLALAFGLSTLLALGAAALVLWRARGARPLALLAGEVGAGPAPRRPGRSWLVLGAAVAALACLAAALSLGAERGGALGFGAGFLALLAGLGGLGRLLARTTRPRSRLALGWTNAARRPGRSLATVASVASSVFLLTVAGASRQGPAGAGGHDSGTGGFAFLGRT
ncbi:MAG TPA: ABC transporter permease, partial [Planctomycetota bacterium]